MKARRPLDDIDDRIASLRESRARLPELVRNRFASRRRRATLGHDGRLLLLSTERVFADPETGHLGPLDRADLLRRIAITLDHPGVDGIIAPADIVDDLLMLEALEDRVVVGSMSAVGGSGGPSGRPSIGGYDAPTIAAMHLEGGSMRCVVDPPEAATVDGCARAITDLAANSLLALLWPSSASHGTAWAAVVASSLGARSAFTWLVVPIGEAVEAVVAATMLPVLVAGEAEVDAAAVEAALVRPGVRGLVVGRSVLYPEDGDVARATDTAARLVHPLR